MNFRSARWGAALVGVLIAEIIMIAAAFAWVAIYSHLIHPGEAQSFYQQYAMLSSPWVSLVVGVPTFYFICRRIGRKAPALSLPTAMVFFGIYFAIDMSLFLFAGTGALSALFVVLNYSFKFGACYRGGKDAEKVTAT